MFTQSSWPLPDSDTAHNRSHSTGPEQKEGQTKTDINLLFHSVNSISENQNICGRFAVLLFLSLHAVCVPVLHIFLLH